MWFQAGAVWITSMYGHVSDSIQERVENVQVVYNLSMLLKCFAEGYQLELQVPLHFYSFLCPALSLYVRFSYEILLGSFLSHISYSTFVPPIVISKNWYSVNNNSKKVVRVKVERKFYGWYIKIREQFSWLTFHSVRRFLKFINNNQIDEKQNWAVEASMEISTMKSYFRCY